MPENELIRVDIRPKVDGKTQKEYPFRVLVLGDFSNGANPERYAERDPLEITKSNFDARLENMSPTLSISVADRIEPAAEGEEPAELPVQLTFTKMDDFSPGAVAQAVPALKRLLEIREALEGFLQPVTEDPELREDLAELIRTSESVEELLAKLKEGGDE